MFSWQKRHLTRSLRSLVRYCFCHSNIKFISSRHHVISSIYFHIQLSNRIHNQQAFSFHFSCLPPHTWTYNVHNGILERYMSYISALRTKTSLSHQGCCLTGARSPGAPKIRVRATKFLLKEPAWAPKHRFSILI